MCSRALIECSVATKSSQLQQQHLGNAATDKAGAPNVTYVIVIVLIDSRCIPYYMQSEVPNV